ncbi:MAG: PH domain-containing protein [Actinomycetota bacterium]|nr:PH domain-containing protein [Actinomycetota bacterium]
MPGTEPLRRLEDATVNALVHHRLDRVIGPTGESVRFVCHRHWLVLLGPATLVMAGWALVLLADEPRPWIVAFAGATILLDRWRRRWSTLRTASAVALWAVPLWLTRDLPTSVFEAGVAVALLAFLLSATAGWWSEALVLTDRSLWRLSGILTTASPKVPLSRILFQDVRESMVEKAFGCGTLSFDTAGGRDGPFARYGPVHQPFVVGARISRQQGQAAARSADLPPTS